MTSAPIKLVQITDTHLCSSPDELFKGMDARESLARVLRLVRHEDWPADLVLATGDLAHDGSAGAYQALCGYLAALDDVPVHCIPGNHDDPALMEKLLSSATVNCVRRRVLDNWQVVLLDSSVPGEVGGTLSAGELAYLDATLRALPGHHALVSLHHQPVPVGSPWIDAMGLSNGTDFLAVLDRNPNVRGVIWGHVHQEYDQLHHDIRLMAAPSTCVQFRPGGDALVLDALGPGYRWLELHADGHIDTGIRRLPGSEH